MQNSDEVDILNGIKYTLVGINKDLTDIKNIINSSHLIYSPPNTQILNSSNLSFNFNPNLLYDVMITLVGTVTADVVVSINSVVNGIGSVSYVNLNNTNYVIRLKGVAINSISASASTIGSVSVYLTSIGYTQNKNISLDGL